MIKCNKKMRIIDYLNKYYPTYEDLNVHICEGCDCIEAPNGTKAFGVFIPQEKQIYVAEDIPEKEYGLPHTIAHEFRHYMQYILSKPFDELDADNFADAIMNIL